MTPLRLLVPAWLFSVLLLAAGTASAQTGFPASFYGSVAAGGQPLPDGTDVRGFIGDIDCTQLGENYRTTVTIDGVSQYAIEVVHESQKEGCGDEGKIVSFVVGGRQARETAGWRAGATRVDLNVGEGTGPTLPPPASTPTLEPTEAAQFTPLTGTPPTDDVTLPVTTPGGLTPQPPASGDDDGSGGGLLVLGAVIVGLLLIGATGGIALSRVRRPRSPSAS